MKQSQKVALAVGAVSGLLTGGALVITASKLMEENARLRIDNINLLRNTLIAIGHLQEGTPVPPEVVNDIEFRRLAFTVEYDDIEEEK